MSDEKLYILSLNMEDRLREITTPNTFRGMCDVNGCATPARQRVSDEFNLCQYHLDWVERETEKEKGSANGE